MPFPIIPLITAAFSLGSSAVKKRKAQQAEKKAEETLASSPRYKPNQSILDYYKKALNKFETAPTDTAQYKSDRQNIKQGTTQALSSLNKLRTGDVANIVQGQSNSLFKAAVNAENRKEREFGILGQAANMKAGQEAKAFQQNELYPFEAKYNLETMKAAGLRSDQRQSTQNFYNNALAAAEILAGGDKDDDDKWGTGTNWLGQQTRSLMGQSFTRGKYNKLNNAWGSNRGNMVGR